MEEKSAKLHWNRTVPTKKDYHINRNMSDNVGQKCSHQNSIAVLYLSRRTRAVAQKGKAW